MAVVITYEVPLNQVQAEIEAGERQIEARLNEVVDETLKYIVNITTYTAGGNPPPPSGSRYRRTFNLLNAGETKRTGTKLPDVSGEWSVNLGKARYGEYVRGTRQQQAPIHRGRWDDRDEVERQAGEKAEQIAQEKLT
jgi:hypothetical protein